jgi:hypothetical protein
MISKAPEGQNIGNKNSRLSILSVVYYQYFAPLGLLEPIIRVTKILRHYDNFFCQ